MADIKQFVATTGFSSQRTHKKSAILQKIHSDQITIKHLSRDSLVALIHKQKKMTASRSDLNEALMQNIKKTQRMEKLLTEKIASLPELVRAISKTPTTSIPGSSTALRSRTPDITKSMPHGFRYRSNGNIHTSRGNSIDNAVDKYDHANRRDVTALKQTLLKTAMTHSRDANGDYMFSPMLLDLLKRESRILKTAPESSENVDIFRFITHDRKQSHQNMSRVDNDLNVQNVVLRDKPLIGKQFLINENNKFINDMLKYIFLLDQSTDSRGYTQGKNTDRISQDYDSFLTGDFETKHNDTALKPAMSSGSKNRTAEAPPVKAKSSFYLRYGVSSQVLESRKPLLDEYMNREMEKISKTELEIEEYIRETEATIKARAKKRNRQGGRGDLSFDFWTPRNSLGAELQDPALPETYRRSSVA